MQDAADPKSLPEATTPTPTTTAPEGEGKTLLTAAEAPVAALAPLTVADIKLPEGFTADETRLTALVETLNKDFESPAQRAEALINLQADYMKGASEAMAKQWSDLQSNWVKEVEADPNLGAETLGAIREFVVESMGENLAQLDEALFVTGAGNNPWIIRLLAKAAAVTREGRPENGTASTTQPKSLAQRLYPNG